MAAGFPVKADYASGDVLTAAQMNDLSGTLNYLDPTAKGDLFPASSGTALTRLAVGANDTVLTADSSTASGLKWAAAAGGGGGMTLLSTTTLSGTTTSITGIDQTYKNLQIIVTGANAASNFDLEISVETGFQRGGVFVSTATTLVTANTNYFGNYSAIKLGGENVFVLNIYDYTSARYKMGVQQGVYINSGENRVILHTIGGWTGATVIDAVTLTATQSLTAGTVLIYGVK